MRAIVTKHGVPGFEIVDVAEPASAPDSVLVDVRAFSINRGELRKLSETADGWLPDWIPGWDFAGVVAGDTGASLEAGTRVVGTIPTGGAWAEHVRVPASHVAVLPEEVSFESAAALPVAGLTALRMLRLVPLLGRSVLVTGASGGVGRFAVQLARLGGARVTAVVGNVKRADGLRDLGAAEVVTDVNTLEGAFDLILEGVGGDSLAVLATRLERHGTLVMFGNSSEAETTFNVRDIYLGRLSQLVSFTLPATHSVDPPGRDLAFLVRLVADGLLDPQVARVVAWNELDAALELLRDRAVNGKVVVVIGEP